MRSQARQIDYHTEPGGVIRACLQVPPDKSISHRAVILGSLAQGKTEITGFLDAADTMATKAALEAMGVAMHQPGAGRLQIHGVGPRGLNAPLRALDLGNSGTGLRLLAGVLAAQPFTSVLSGDASLTRRPMGRIIQPLRQMGAVIQAEGEDHPPLQIQGRPLRPLNYRLPLASAQLKSCLLLAALHVDGTSHLQETGPSRDHTEKMFKSFGQPLEMEGSSIRLRGGTPLQGTTLSIPGDLSSAAFLLIAAAITPGSDLEIKALGVNPTRSGVLSILQRMGARLELRHPRSWGEEEVADVRIRHAPLQGINIEGADVPLAIDELPVLLIAAACAKGVTTLSDAGELRVKESDRLMAMADGLKRLGVEVQMKQDGLVMRGGMLQAGEVDSHSDHRIAMAFAVAGLRSQGPLQIRNCGNVGTSFPGFVELCRQAGHRISEYPGPPIS